MAEQCLDCCLPWSMDRSAAFRVHSSEQAIDLTHGSFSLHQGYFDVGHPYHPLLGPRTPPEYSPRNTDVSSGPISPFNLPPASFMGHHGLLGAFQPYPSILPLVPAENKTCPLISRPLSGSVPLSSGKRSRGEKKPIPDEQKDEKYFERRKRNNQAAKKSRDARKIREDQIAMRAAMLEHENAILRAQVITLREEAQSLRSLLLQKKSSENSQVSAPDDAHST